jgi:geranylgeranyl pyrophosphate synthase
VKLIPETRELRERIRGEAQAVAVALDKTRPLAKHEIQSHAERILDAFDLPEGYLGWTMVILASAFWGNGVAGIPYQRRLLLLPRCLREAETCQAKTNELGLLCEDCGACCLTELRTEAQALGYHVLIAEGTPIVMQMILAGQADAILGVGCLNVLEKALDKILLAGLPCMAVPLLTDTCHNTSTDEDWVREMIATPYRGGASTTRTHVHLLRCAARMFEPDEFERLVPMLRGGPKLPETNGEGLSALEPVASTEQIARDFVLRGGKHYRPFITLAAYDAMTGERAQGPDGESVVAAFPDAVKRVALAMEVFHKASLVHDDVEDDDAFRYGQPALHREYGSPMAINVGDYLIGLGYRLVADQQAELGADVAVDILARLGEAHTKLCEGQGAEFAWAAAKSANLGPLDALRVYALKTAPAFGAALFAGLRMAGPADDFVEPCARFARHLGVGFQILNDLEDRAPDEANKRTSGTDLLAGRPTVLLALAMDRLGRKDRAKLASLVAEPTADSETFIRQVQELYDRAGVYEKAALLVQKHRQRARDVADGIEHRELRRLLHYFVDTILERSAGH